MRQTTPITNECTPEKKEAFQSLRKEYRHWEHMLNVLEGNRNSYGSKESYEENHRVISRVMEELRNKAEAILNGKPGTN